MHGRPQLALPSGCAELARPGAPRAWGAPLGAGAAAAPASMVLSLGRHQRPRGRPVAPRSAGHLQAGSGYSWPPSATPGCRCPLLLSGRAGQAASAAAKKRHHGLLPGLGSNHPPAAVRAPRLCLRSGFQICAQAGHWAHRLGGPRAGPATSGTSFGRRGGCRGAGLPPAWPAAAKIQGARPRPRLLDGAHRR